MVGGDVDPEHVPPIKATATDEQRAETEKERNEAREPGRPRIDGGFTLLPDLAFTVPLLLIGGDPVVGLAGGQLPDVRRLPDRHRGRDQQGVVDDPEGPDPGHDRRPESLFLLTVFLFVVDCSGAGC